MARLDWIDYVVALRESLLRRWGGAPVTFEVVALGVAQPLCATTSSGDAKTQVTPLAAGESHITVAVVAGAAAARIDLDCAAPTETPTPSSTEPASASSTETASPTATATSIATVTATATRPRSTFGACRTANASASSYGSSGA